MGRHALKPVVGLAGLMGSGKSTVARMLCEHFGWLHVEVDHLGHEALAACADEVRTAFGTTERRELGALVFPDPAARARLEAIVHPWMKAELARRIAASGARGVLVNAALLFTMGLDRDCTSIVVVKAPWSLRLRRLMERDGITREAVLTRMRAQSALLPKDRLHNADTVIVMNRTSRRTVRFLIDDLEYRYGPEKDHHLRGACSRRSRRVHPHRHVADGSQPESRPENHCPADGPGTLDESTGRRSPCRRP